MITVLWIDDEPGSDSLFEDYAYNENQIDVYNFRTVDDGIDELRNPCRLYDAIILDANCKLRDTKEIETVNALGYAINQLAKHNIDLPWFVYSGGGFEGESVIDNFVASQYRPYDEKSWYRKPSERGILLDKITEVVGKSDEYKIKTQYAEIFDFYPHDVELLEILTYLDPKKQNDAKVYTLIRKELESILKYCYTCGVILEDVGISINEGSKLVSSNTNVPVYIQRSFHSCVEICNNGSHRLEKIRRIEIDEATKKGKAPYLIRSTIYELLNIISWIKDLPKEEEDRRKMRERTKAALEEGRGDNEDNSEIISSDYSKYEGKRIVVECDGENYHCGECYLNPGFAKRFVGKEVVLVNVQKNGNWKTKQIYPYYAEIKS